MQPNQPWPPYEHPQQQPEQPYSYGPPPAPSPYGPPSYGPPPDAPYGPPNHEYGPPEQPHQQYEVAPPTGVQIPEMPPPPGVAHYHATGGIPTSGMPGPGVPTSGFPAPGMPTSGIPTSGMMPPPGPPMTGPMFPAPPKKSNTGLVLGLVGGGLVLVLLLCVGGAVALRAAGVFGGNEQRRTPAAANQTPQTPRAVPTTTGPATPTYSPTPRATVRDLSTLDNVTTDRTPFELAQFFPTASFTGETGVVFNRSGTGFYSACENTGGTRMKALMRANGCGNMAVGVYLDQANTISTGVMVIPLPDSSKAQAVKNAIKADRNLALEMWIWCPSTGLPGADVCKRSNSANIYRQWLFDALHRYLIIAIAIHTDGRSKGDTTALSRTVTDCLTHVWYSVPKIR